MLFNYIFSYLFIINIEISVMTKKLSMISYKKTNSFIENIKFIGFIDLYKITYRKKPVWSDSVVPVKSHAMDTSHNTMVRYHSAVPVESEKKRDVF